MKEITFTIDSYSFSSVQTALQSSILNIEEISTTNEIHSSRKEEQNEINEPIQP